MERSLNKCNKYIKDNELQNFITLSWNITDDILIITIKENDKMLCIKIYYQTRIKLSNTQTY